MTPDQYQRVGQLYHQALELERDQRLAFLDRECADDAVLRREVESLIASHEEEETFLATPAVEVMAKQMAEKGVLTISQQIGHYHILSLLGKGGMGEVYLAQDTMLSRKVALKVLPAQFTQDQERVHRFEREARAASTLNHPNILAIHEIGQTSIGHYIVTEFVEGETLRQRCEQTKLSLLEALEITIQIASALAAAHEAGVIHRDIKPDNVMLRRDGYVKVLDFGLAKLVDKVPEDLSQVETTQRPDTTTPGVVMGTVAYMSPEQARGLKVDARTDIWSLGVLLYEIVTGSRPFNGSTTSDLIAAILDKEPPSLLQHAPDAPAELERIVGKALEKEREYRYQTAGDLLLDLKRLKRQMESGTESASTVALRSADSSKGKRSRRSMAVWSSALALLVAGTAIGLYWWVGHKATPAKAVRVAPITSFPGIERYPTVSRDGKQIAFVWNGEKEDNDDLYVKLVDAGAPLQLTTTPERELFPAWSPDGRYVAFVRYFEDSSETGLFVVPALGGAERKLFSAPWINLSRDAWSPDGKLLAVSVKETREQPMTLFLLTIENLEKRQLTSPPPGVLGGDGSAAFSPDGKTLAFARGRDDEFVDIYLVPITGGEPKRLTFDNQIFGGLTWTSDGHEIVFSSGREGSMALWKVTASGGTPERLTVGGVDSSSPHISRQGDRLVYQRRVYDTNIWRAELPNQNKVSTPPIRLISSSTQELFPAYSPDGTKIVFTSGRTGSWEIWVCNSDGSNWVPLTSYGAQSGFPSWSPDSRYVAFHSLREDHFDIYVVGVEGGLPRRLTTESFDEFDPSWSRDGRWIYFESNRTGTWQIWKIPVEGGQPLQVTSQGGRNATASPDGKFVFYRRQDSIWGMPVEGGEETHVLDQVFGIGWAVLDGGIYFTNRSTRSFEFFSFATKRASRILAFDPKKLPVQLSVSPDGRWLIYTHLDRNEGDIMLVENFR